MDFEGRFVVSGTVEKGEEPLAAVYRNLEELSSWRMSDDGDWKGLIHGYFHSSHGKSFLVILQLAVRNSYSTIFNWLLPCAVCTWLGFALDYISWTSPVFPVDFRSFGAWVSSSSL